MTTKEKIAQIRGLMKEKGLDAYLVNSSDPHQSEYVPKRWGTRPWLSGFTGSAGTLVITTNEAGLWTDSRYFIQAEIELKNSSIKLQKQGVAHMPEHLDWLKEQLSTDGKLGFDGQVTSLAQARLLERKLGAKGIHLVGQYDLADKIWNDRPDLPQSLVFEHGIKFTGTTRVAKIARLRNWLQENKTDVIFFPALDDIAWVLNIRASDVEANPVCLSYLLLTQDEVIWCVDDTRIDKPLLKKLKEEGIQLKAYGDVLNELKKIPASKKITIDPSTISFTFYEALSANDLIEMVSPVQAMKAMKNATEVSNIKKAMQKDGVALLRLFRWLEGELNHRTISEVEVATQLAQFRSEQEYYHGESFSAIVGYKGNGAIVHYHAQKGSCAHIKKEGMLLLDSGGQYWDGTTDITRTIFLGDHPREEQKEHFTLVLKGMIGLSQVQFPQGTCGLQLDILARQYLWQQGLNYGHGTGHGVGFFLNVHEGPQAIMPNANAAKGRISVEAGMITSNEPGFYRENHYGIRIENLVLCVEGEQTTYGQFLKFETLTMFPISSDLIDLPMLNANEIAWLNAYHKKVYEVISPFINEEERGWLKEKTQELAP